MGVANIKKKTEEGPPSHVPDEHWEARANAAEEELEKFIYAVSHDLRSPVRQMMTFASFLEQDLGDELTGKPRLYVDQLKLGGRRAQAMLDALLTYSRIDTRGRAKEKVQSGDLVEAVLFYLRSEIDEAQATILVEELPLVACDPEQLKEVFQILLSNSLLYRSSHCEIRLSATTLPNSELQFSVIDNGVGMPNGDLQRPFEMFQRLHAQDEFPGLGAGLSIAHKIIARHGGKIWFEKSDCQGSTLHFTLAS